MNTFFSSTFVKEETLKEASIYHPIKLEYYKHTNEEAENEPKFGINIVKKAYKKEGIKMENKEFVGLSNNEQEIEEILNLLGTNEVTPTEAEYILNDIKYKTSMKI